MWHKHKPEQSSHKINKDLSSEGEKIYGTEDFQIFLEMHEQDLQNAFKEESKKLKRLLTYQEKKNIIEENFRKAKKFADLLEDNKN